MHQVRRHPIVIVLLGLVLLAPLFEFFDQSQDLEQGSDLVLVLLSVFASAGLFLLCKPVVSILVRSLLAGIPAEASLPLLDQSIRVEVSPPECLILLGSLRI